MEQGCEFLQGRSSPRRAFNCPAARVAPADCPPPLAAYPDHPLPTTPPPLPRRSGKIDGVDYYDYCELIRTSSL